MDQSAFDTAKAKLYATVLRVSQSGEQPEDADTIRTAIRDLTSISSADSYWSREVLKLREEISSLPLLSSDLRKRSVKTGYETTLRMLESWR